MTYTFKEITVKGYYREKPKHKWVSSYKRKQRFGHDPDMKAKKLSQFKILSLQSKEKDWSHQSLRYPNIIGLNDKQIQDFIKKQPEGERKELELYLEYIRAYTPTDIKELSRELYHEFDTDMKKFNKENPKNAVLKNRYDSNKTIFTTSPKGGLEILSQFAYANFSEIHKRNLPYDLDRATNIVQDESVKVLRSEALPYAHSINDVNDIVFIDDIYMSGEQSGRALDELRDKLSNLGITPSQHPRLHYIAITGNIEWKTSDNKKQWERKNGSFRVGKDYAFSYFSPTTPENKKASAIVFPFSIPDGSRHRNARRLYRFHKKFPHRQV